MLAYVCTAPDNTVSSAYVCMYLSWDRFFFIEQGLVTCFQRIFAYVFIVQVARNR